MTDSFPSERREPPDDEWSFVLWFVQKRCIAVYLGFHLTKLVSWSTADDGKILLLPDQWEEGDKMGLKVPAAGGMMWLARDPWRGWHVTLHARLPARPKGARGKLTPLVLAIIYGECHKKDLPILAGARCIHFSLFFWKSSISRKI